MEIELLLFLCYVLFLTTNYCINKNIKKSAIFLQIATFFCEKKVSQFQGRICHFKKNAGYYLD